jgi:hypothetical protein
VVSAYLDIKNPMSLEQRKVTDLQLKGLFKDLLKQDGEILSNYGVDINSTGVDK